MKFLKYILLVLLFSVSSAFSLEPQGPKFTRIQKQEIQKFKQKVLSDIKPNLDYIKIGTDKDAPAIVPVVSLLRIYPHWNQKDYKHLILYLRDKKIPYYLIDDNGLIDDADTIIFLGSRPLGDTTWTDHYAKVETFLLTYNEEDIRLELKEIIDDGSYVNKLNKIVINSHIEKDLIYSPGPDTYDTHTADNEGWYWKEILPYSDQPNQNTFTFPLILKPVEDSQIEIKLVFKSTTDTLFKGFGSNKYPEYRIALFFNGDSLDVREFTRIHNDTFKLVLNSNRVLYGINILQVKSYEVHPFRLGVVGIDYIKIQYQSEPYKYYYANSFELNDLQSKSFLDIENLTNNRIIVIDETNNTIQFPKSVEMTSELNITMRSDKPIFSAYLNDSSVYNQYQGIHLVKINKKGSLTNEHHYYYDEVAFNKMLKEATNNDVFIFAYNEPSRKIPDEFLKSIQSLNIELKVTNNLSIGNMMLVVFQKNNLLYEEAINTNTYSKQLKFQNIFQLHYKAKVLSPPTISSKLFISSQDDFSNTTIKKVNKPYLFDKNNKTDVMIVYSREFEDFKNKYVAFRQKTEPQLTYKTIEVEDIFNELNFGKRSPYAIKNFLYFAKNNWQDSIKTLVIIGNASWDVSKRMSYTVSTDFVPSYGFPPADYWYTLLDEDLRPDINVGRISIHSVEDGENYYQKLVDYYSIPDQPWMKNFLFLSGGENDDERAKFARIKSYFFDEYIKYDNFCGTSDSVAKYDKNIGGTAEAGEIREKINRGALWVNFLGHANQSIFDMDGWQVNKLNNYQKYSFFSTISCNTGAHADPGIIHSRNEDYVYFKDKGFIGSIGSSTFGWVDENRFIILRIIQNLSDPNSKLEYIGDLLNYGKNGLANEGAQLQTKFHNALIGDPLLKLRVSRLPNLYTYATTVSIKNRTGSNDVSISDSIAVVAGEIYNNGLKLNEDVALRVYNIYDNKIDSADFVISSICFNSAFQVEFNISNQPGEHIVRIVIDPENKFDYLKPENKVLEKSFYVYSPTLLPIDPQENWDVSSTNPIFRVINKLHNEKTSYFFSIHNSKNMVYESTFDEFYFNENYLDWKPSLNLTEGYYQLTAFYVDGNNLKSNELKINFYAKNSIEKRFVNSQIISQTNFNKSDNYRTQFYEKENRVALSESTKRVKLISVSGDWDRNIIEWGVMEVGDKVYLDARYYRGFNILVFPDSSGDTEPIYRRFDTWVDGDDWTSDSSAAKLNLFLRDSVPDNSYIFLATSSRSFKIPVLIQMYRPENVGSMDTLRSILREYGSALIDSIQGEYTYPAVSWYAWKHSFAMIGKKGWKSGEAIEAMRDDGDTAMVEANVKFFSKNGYINFNKIGPLSKLKSVKIQSNADINSLLDYSINFSISNKDGELATYQLKSNNEVIDLDNLTTNDLFTNLLLSFERKNQKFNPFVKSLELVYEPPVELAISKKETLIDQPISTRDINNTMQISVENISPRKSSGQFNFNITSNNSFTLTNQKIDNIEPNERIFVKYTLLSENLSNDNNLDIRINSNNNPIEQYLFNNSHTLFYELINDKQKPKINVTFDDKSVKDADYISLHPLIKVQVYDNILTPTKDSGHIEIFINGLFITKENTDYYYLNLNPNRDNLKSELYFIPNNLEYGTSKISPANYLKLIAKDQLGNSDTLIFRVNVQQNNTLSEVVTFPNPLLDDEITIQFSYFGRNIKEKLLISIFNLNGQLINSFDSFCEIGQNEKKIILQDINGAKLPRGTYFFRIEVKSNLWTEPRNGVFLKMN